MFLKNEQIILEYPKDRSGGDNVVKADDILIPGGDVLIQEGRYEEAVELYNQALELCPTHRYAQLRKADALLNQGNTDAAVTDYIQLINHEKKGELNIVRHAGLARLGFIFLYERLDYSAAIEYFNQALQIDANDHVILGCRGEALYRSDLSTEAHQDFEAALRLNPNYYPVLLLLGECFYNKAQLEAARQMFDRVLVNAPNNISALFYRGRISRKEHLFSYALADWNRLLTIDANHVKALLRRCEMFLNYIGDFRSALSDAEQALTISPKNLVVLEFRYRALMKLGRFEEALNDINSCLSIMPTQVSDKEQRAWVLYELHHYEQAASEVAELRQLNPLNTGYVDLEHLIKNRVKPGIDVVSNNFHYRKGNRRNSLLSSAGQLMTPVDNQSLDGRNAFTRLFYEVGDEQKQPRKVVKSPRSRVSYSDAFELECRVWNLFYPELPAIDVHFKDQDCRLVLPFIPGKTLNKVGSLSLVEWLQIWLVAALELDRLHKKCKQTHGDLKTDNIIVERQSSHSFAPFHVHLIDFGLSVTLGDSVRGYKCGKSLHIAPEMYGRGILVTAKPDKDVYSFSGEVLKTVQNLPSELREFLEKGCDHDPSRRPHLSDIISRLLLVLLNHSLQLCPGDEESIRGDVFLSQFFKQLKLSGAQVLLEIIDQFDEPLQKVIQQSPALVEAIVSRYQQHQAEFKNMKNFVLDMHHHAEKTASDVSVLKTNSIFLPSSKRAPEEHLNSAAALSSSP